MELSPELIGALVIALTGLLTGITGLVSKKSRELRIELDELREERKNLREQLVLADRWIFLMKRSAAQNGFEPPEAPDGLVTVEKR